MIFWSCIVFSDFITGIIRLISESAFIVPFRLRYCFRVMPSRYSIIIYAVLFASKES